MHLDLDIVALRQRFDQALPAGVGRVRLRLVEETTSVWTVRDDVALPPMEDRDVGVMIAVVRPDGIGHAATADLSVAGLRQAIERAGAWADAVAGRLVFDPAEVAWPRPGGVHVHLGQQPWHQLSPADRVERLVDGCRALAGGSRVVSRTASLRLGAARHVLLDSDGGSSEQVVAWATPELQAVGARDGLVQRRSWGNARQGGVEVLEGMAWERHGPRVVEELEALLDAPPCPDRTCDVVLAPDQMMLQIHESIGHPIELDRILGDERNYAGTSFVTLDMLGTYRYGSELLDVTFDPGVTGELASYGVDDDGTPAEPVRLIERGILRRPLGGAVSAARAGLPPLACARSTSWNRPTMDRMANLNLEPGTSSLAAVIGGVEDGVWMETNASWSIDDSRNKFQFGCEFGRRIVDGELREVVRGPGYRGVSSAFWRQLVDVGDRSTFEIHGTPWCGKGEPNQIIRVGHASPVCRFADVAVFGGA